MVVFNRHFGRVVTELVAPCIAGVLIDRRAVAVEFPYCGNAQFVPTLVVVGSLKEVERALVGVSHPEEVPYSVDT